MEKIRENIVELIFYVFTLTVLIPQTLANYVLSWDDADYLRVSSCFSNHIIYFDFVGLINCERLIYKAPIFEHLGLFTGFILKVMSVFMPVTQTILIKISIISLIAINCAIFTVLIRQFHSIFLKGAFALFFFSLFHNHLALFMTDTLASLIAALMVLIHNRGSSRFTYKVIFQIQSSLFVLAFGTRTTCAPLFLFAFYAGYRFYFADRDSFKRVIRTFVVTFSILLLLLLTIWKSVIPAAWAMFQGNQSKYFEIWTNRAQINLMLSTLSTYRIPIVLIMLFLIIFIKNHFGGKKEKYFFLELAPSLSVFLLFLISSSKDPRFLLWPLFAIGYSLLIQLDFNAQLTRVNHNFLTFASLLILFAISSAFAINQPEFGLARINSIYNHIPAKGVVCPLTDSDSVNLSKLLLVDNLNNNRLGLNNRVINLPDFAMNGMSREEAFDTSKNCNFAYVDQSVSLGSMKNEYTKYLISNAFRSKYLSKNLKDKVTIYYRS